MGAAKVLLVEDSEVWQAILQMHISEALPGSDPPQVVGTYQDGAHALRQAGWDLIVTDIGLPPDSGHVLGMQLVNLAKEADVPCIVVSGTEAVTKQLVRDLLVGEDYLARDFFSKEELRSSPAIQRRFQSLIRSITADESQVGLGQSGIDRATLVRTVAGLSPSDMAILVTLIEGAAIHVGRQGTVPEQAADLIRWAEASNGPGLVAIKRALESPRSAGRG
jgi:DNA-binding response OmpR family regulator